MEKVTASPVKTLQAHSLDTADYAATFLLDNHRPARIVAFLRASRRAIARSLPALPLSSVYLENKSRLRWKKSPGFTSN